MTQEHINDTIKKIKVLWDRMFKAVRYMDDERYSLTERESHYPRFAQLLKDISSLEALLNVAEVEVEPLFRDYMREKGLDD